MRKSDSEKEGDADLIAAVPRYLRAHGSQKQYDENYKTFEGDMGRNRNVGILPNAAKEDKRSFCSVQRMLGVVGVFFTLAVLLRKSSGASRTPATEQPLQDLERGGNFEVDESDPLRSEVLTLEATNEYGEFDQRALALYGLEMVVEPHRETTISVLQTSRSQQPVRFHWLLVRSNENGVPLEAIEAEVDSIGGRYATVTLTQAGGTYILLVRQLRADGSVAAEGRATITCKYVRRELRQLSEEDRTGFFAAMREWYTIPDEESKEKYGEEFSTARRVAAMHNSNDFCYHNGIHFLTAHTAFNLWVERSLQMIDPKVSLASWDFMLEAAILGTNWPSSEVFGPDMFGSATGTAETSFQIKDGWFANISSVYDPMDAMSTEFSLAGHNPFGYVGALFDYQDLPGVTRTHSFCGLKGEAEFAQCDLFISCFDDYNTLYDWATCMETQVHASMHGVLGGGFNCNTDMAVFHTENPQYSAGLLTFVMEYLLANKWPKNGLMSDYNECDEACDQGQTEPCGCTCTTDPFDWEDDEVYDFMEEYMEDMSARFHGNLYVFNDTSVRNSLGFQQNGERMDEASSMHIMRQMMVVGCEPGAVGAMCGGASPLDPIFWVLHPAFEKALHILTLSPSYRDTYNMTWVDGTCNGSRSDDQLPFTEQLLGLGDGTDMLTNEGVLALLHPSNAMVPYLYDNFNQWGTCTSWDPCPECVTSLRIGGGLPPAGPS